MARHLAFQLDPHTLRLACAEIGERLRVEEVAVHELPEGHDANTVANLIVQFVNRTGLGKADTSLVISRGHIEYRVMELPSAPDDELPDLVRYQAKGYFSTSSGEGQIIDFIRLQNGKETTPIYVLAASAAQADYKKLVNLADAARVRLRHVLPRPFALANLLARDLTASKYSLLINTFGQDADLSVTYRNRIILTRTVRLPSEVDGQIPALMAEIRRTMSAARNQPSGGTIQRMIILGDTPLHRELATAIDQQLQLPTELKSISDFASLSPAAAKVVGADDGSFGPLLGSFGLSSEPAEHLIDFVQPHRRKETVEDPGRKIRLGAIAGVALATVLAFVLFMIFQRRGEIRSLQAELQRLNANSDARDLLIGKVETIDRWKLGDINWLDELFEVSSRFPLPDEAIVTQLSTSVSATSEDAGISLSTKISQPSVESDMVRDLGDRPYTIALGKTVPLADNKLFTRSLDMRLHLPMTRRLIDQVLKPSKKNPVVPAENASPPAIDPAASATNASETQ